jgi:integrase
MSSLHLVSSNAPIRLTNSRELEQLQDHMALLERYLRSHQTRNHSPKTLVRERSFLEGWFESHGPRHRPLFTWEAMAPVSGRQRISDYALALIESGVTSDTSRSYIGILSRYFAYVLEHSFLNTPQGVRHIPSLYGPIEQPVSEYDLPHHVYDGERLGVPMDPERLYEFYALLRKEYLKAPGACRATRARNYTLAVIAGEGGMRADELMHLEISRDLFFESKKLQTRFAKGTQGSGKRSRVTLFPPLARDTTSFYLKQHRPLITDSCQSDYLFPSKTGKLLTYAALRDSLKEMCEVARRAGFSIAPHMSWHWFRRFFATRFIERFPHKMPALIELLGHMSPNTVHRYIRHSEAWMDREMQSVLEGEATLSCPFIGD